VIAWTFLEGVSREVFQEGLALDEATWARGRGWALWKAAIVLVQALESDPDDARECVRVLSEVLGDHKASIRSRTKSQGETDRAGKAE
jgi:aminoglycoside phosphotransferase (APT) family kinase protein